MVRMGSAILWLAKYAAGGIVSFAAPRLLVALGFPLDRWIIAMASWLSIHIDRETALWGATVIAGASLYVGSVLLSKDHDWRPSIPQPVKRLLAKVEPSHVIILGLIIALGGVIWQWQRPSPSDPKISQLQSQVDDLTTKLAETKRVNAPTAKMPAPPPQITTAAADVPKKLAAIDALRKILNDEMLPWINKGQQLSTAGWLNEFVSDQIPQMQDAARDLYLKSKEMDEEIHRLQNENVQFPDIHALASSPLGTPFLLKIEKLVTPILALPTDPSMKMGTDLYRFLFEPYAKETYAALNDVQNWRSATGRNALELRKQLSQ